MGGGSYSYKGASAKRFRTAAVVNTAYSESAYVNMTSAELSVAMNSMSTSDYQKVFTARSLDPEMNIKGKVRESCDSKEHPNAYPIIIALDVTGSMSTIPGELITQSFPEIMKSIMDAGVVDAQVCFVGIGDDVYDRAPIQVGQFETSDDLTEKWLKKIYLEGGGGGNDGESYGYAWYFAAHHTKIDSFLKHGKKGCLITVGDEPILRMYSKHSIERDFGDNLEDDVNISSLYEEVSEQWEVYHIAAGRGAKRNWTLLPSSHLINTERSINSISKGIIQAILEAYGISETPVTQETPKSETTTETPSFIR